MAKEIYMNIVNSHINQRLANFIIDKQLPVWDKIKLLKYKSMYPILKIWIPLEL